LGHETAVATSPTVFCAVALACDIITNTVRFIAVIHRSNLIRRHRTGTIRLKNAVELPFVEHHVLNELVGDFVVVDPVGDEVACFWDCQEREDGVLAVVAACLPF